MIDNPIYVGGSGPVYDSIMTQPQRMQSTGSDQKDTCITNPHYESLNTTADTDRYIGQPIQPSLKPCHASSSSSVHKNETQHVSCSTTTASASTMIGFKSNGEPRNKLGLTLSLGGEDSITEDNTPAARIMHGIANVSSVDVDDEEPYAVMNPTSSLVQKAQEKELPTD